MEFGMDDAVWKCAVFSNSRDPPYAFTFGALAPAIAAAIKFLRFATQRMA